MVDRRLSPPIATAPEGRIATITVTVLEHRPGANRRAPYRVVVKDESAEMDLVYFHVKGDWVEKLLPVGQKRVISGKIERYRDRAQMPHP